MSDTLTKTVEKKKQEYRTRRFFFSLQDYDGKKIVDILGPLKWAYILHDKDKLEDGTPKTPHTHIYMEFESGRGIKAVARALGLDKEHYNLVERLKRSKSGALRYLVHIDDPMKHQYNHSEVIANFDWWQELGDTQKSEWLDLLKVKQGEMTAKEFYEQHSERINSAPLNAKLSIFNRVHELQEKAPLNKSQRTRLKLIKSEIIKELKKKLIPFEDVIPSDYVSEIAYNAISRYLTKEVLLDGNE